MTSRALGVIYEFEDPDTDFFGPAMGNSSEAIHNAKADVAEPCSKSTQLVANNSTKTYMNRDTLLMIIANLIWRRSTNTHSDTKESITKAHMNAYTSLAMREYYNTLNKPGDVKHVQTVLNPPTHR